MGNHFWRVDWNKYSPKWNRARHAWRVTFFLKLANKYQINNTVMFNNWFCRFWQVINLVKKDQHSLKSCVDLFFLNFVIFVFKVLMRGIKHVCQTRFRHIHVFNFMFSHRIRLKYFIMKLTVAKLCGVWIVYLIFLLTEMKWHGGMFSYQVQWLIKCWINDAVNRKFNCFGSYDILKL